jgi:hypothetical protein
MNDETVEVLVLADAAGNYYAIPRATLDRHKVPGEQRAALEKQLGADVIGFTMQNPYLMEQLAGYRRTEMLHEAAQERMARAARSAGSEDGANTNGGPLGWGTNLVGRFVRLAPAKPQRAADAAP